MKSVPVKPMLALVVVCAVASACSVRSHTTVERPAPAPASAAVVVSPPPTTTTVVVPSN